MTVLGGTCVDGSDVGGEYDLERLSPGGAGPGALAPHHARAETPVRMSASQLDGTWFDPGSSTLLVIGRGVHGLVPDLRHG